MALQLVHGKSIDVVEYWYPFLSLSGKSPLELAEELGETKIAAALSGGPQDKQVVELRRQVSRMVDDLKQSNERVSSEWISISISPLSIRDPQTIANRRKWPNWYFPSREIYMDRLKYHFCCMQTLFTWYRRATQPVLHTEDECEGLTLYNLIIYMYTFLWFSVLYMGCKIWLSEGQTL